MGREKQGAHVLEMREVHSIVFVGVSISSTTGGSRSVDPETDSSLGREKLF